MKCQSLLLSSESSFQLYTEINLQETRQHFHVTHCKITLDFVDQHFLNHSTFLSKYFHMQVLANYFSRLKSAILGILILVD